MSPKFAKLIQRIQDVQKFATAKANRSPSLVAVAEELGNLVATLQSSKLKVKLVSKHPLLAEALGKMLKGQTFLTSRYQFEIAPLPTYRQAVGESSASLKLYDRANGTKTRYLLPSDRKVTIGRSSDCQILLPVEWSEVSRHHAEVRPFLNSGVNEASFGWMVSDLSSANGTYVNGNRLNPDTRHVLQEGDRIVLGKPNTSLGDREFVFELPSQSAVSQLDESQPILADCDILCMLFNPAQAISISEKQLIEKANQGRLLKLLVVSNVSAIYADSPAVTANIAELQTWISTSGYDRLVEICNLDLQPFFADNNQSAIASKASQELDKFIQFIANIASSQNEDILKEQVKERFVEQLSIIDSIYEKQLKLINERVKKERESLGDRTIEQANEQIKKVLKQISDDKDRTFQEIRFQFQQSRISLVDPFGKNSLPYKIQQFTDELTPVVTKENGQNLLRLRSDQMGERETINNYITRLCNKEMLKWSDEEWQRICQTYQNGGLKSFFQRSFAALDFIPDSKLSAELFQPPPRFDASKYLQVSVVEFNKTHIASQDPNRAGDIMVLLTSGAMALIPGVGFAGLIMAGVHLLNKNIAQKQNLDNRQEQQAEALKRGIYNHYQSLVKSMTEKVGQGFVLAMQMEERRIKEVVERSVEDINAHLLIVKKKIEESNAQQNTLKKEKAELLAILQKP